MWAQLKTRVTFVRKPEKAKTSETEDHSISNFVNASTLPFLVSGSFLVFCCGRRCSWRRCGFSNKCIPCWSLPLRPTEATFYFLRSVHFLQSTVFFGNTCLGTFDHPQLRKVLHVDFCRGLLQWSSCAAVHHHNLDHVTALLPMVCAMIECARKLSTASDCTTILKNVVSTLCACISAKTVAI